MNDKVQEKLEKQMVPESAEFLIETGTVSYTHLDVYKRQLQRSLKTDNDLDLKQTIRKRKKFLTKEWKSDIIQKVVKEQKIKKKLKNKKT